MFSAGWRGIFSRNGLGDPGFHVTPPLQCKTSKCTLGREQSGSERNHPLPSAQAEVTRRLGFHPICQTRSQD